MAGVLPHTYTCSLQKKQERDELRAAIRRDRERHARAGGGDASMIDRVVVVAPDRPPPVTSVGPVAPQLPPCTCEDHGAVAVTHYHGRAIDNANHNYHHQHHQHQHHLHQQHSQQQQQQYQQFPTSSPARASITSDDGSSSLSGTRTGPVSDWRSLQLKLALSDSPAQVIVSCALLISFVRRWFRLSR
jgi:hypothetical protein